jgi:hypothetical protein
LLGRHCNPSWLDEATWRAPVGIPRPHYRNSGLPWDPIISPLAWQFSYSLD